MNARNSSRCGMAIVMIAFLCQAATADDGRPSRDTLADMGLGGLVVVSDDAALSVRGMGYKGRSSVHVFGNSFATINSKFGGAHSENGYTADGKHFAAGKNFSKAGVTIISSKGKKNHGGNSKPTWGGNSRPPYGGGMNGGHGGGHVQIKSVKVFAGGSSSAVAF